MYLGKDIITSICQRKEEVAIGGGDFLSITNDCA